MWAQVVENLPSEREALSSNPNAVKRKERKKKKKEIFEVKKRSLISQEVSVDTAQRGSTGK